VHALTDVTGFGFAGHLLEICKGSGVAARVDWHALPLLPGLADLVGQGMFTGASGRNWSGYGQRVVLDEALPQFARAVVTDPQTSGGLLVACAAEAVGAVLATFREDGFDEAAIVGEIVPGEPRVTIA